MPINRVCLEPLNQRDYPSAEWKLALDLVLVDDGHPIHAWTTYGVRGGLAEESSCIEPFLLFGDGTMDFGTDFDEDRTCETNFLSGRRFGEGELFTVIPQGGDEITYRVTRMIKLDTRQTT